MATVWNAAWRHHLDLCRARSRHYFQGSSEFRRYRMIEGGLAPATKDGPTRNTLIRAFSSLPLQYAAAWQANTHHPSGPKATGKAEILSAAIVWELGTPVKVSRQAVCVGLGCMLHANAPASMLISRRDVSTRTITLSLGGFCDGCAEQLYNKRLGHALPDNWESMDLARIQTNLSRFVPNFPQPC